MLCACFVTNGGTSRVNRIQSKGTLSWANTKQECTHVLWSTKVMMTGIVHSKKHRKQEAEYCVKSNNENNKWWNFSILPSNNHSSIEVRFPHNNSIFFYDNCISLNIADSSSLARDGSSAHKIQERESFREHSNIKACVSVHCLAQCHTNLPRSCKDFQHCLAGRRLCHMCRPGAWAVIMSDCSVCIASQPFCLK